MVGTPVSQKALLLALAGTLLAAGSALAVPIQLIPVADTYTRDGVGAGSAENLDVRGFGGGDFVAYIRFDLSGLGIDTIISSTLTLHETAGSRNDGITNGRHQLYGLTNASGNTPQNWLEATDIDPGAEYDNTGGNGIDLAQVFNLDADAGANVTESVPGTDGVAVTTSGLDLVTFLNSRVDDNGLVTFIVAIDADNRGYGFASRENSNSDLRPTLLLDYTAIPQVPEPGSVALLSLGLVALLGRRRQRRRG